MKKTSKILIAASIMGTIMAGCGAEDPQYIECENPVKKDGEIYCEQQQQEENDDDIDFKIKKKSKISKGSKIQKATKGFGGSKVSGG